MATHEQLLDLSDRLYAVLLSFYPRRFRARFGAEMTQTFRDCSRVESAGDLFRLWTQTLRDFAFSIVREWHREWNRPNPEIDFTGIVDAFMVSVVVGTNLIGWGWMGAVVTLNLTVPKLMDYRNTAATILAIIVTVAMAALIGILSALAVARGRRAERTRLKV